MKTESLRSHTVPVHIFSENRIRTALKKIAESVFTTNDPQPPGGMQPFESKDMNF